MPVISLVWFCADAFFLSDDPRVPVHLLVYAVQTALTTATCIADYMSWSDYLNSQKIELGKLYVPYLALCTLPLAPIRISKFVVAD